jgi:hypothetical protein
VIGGLGGIVEIVGVQIGETELVEVQVGAEQYIFVIAPEESV